MNEPRQQPALVVGGTGMLAGVSSRILDAGYPLVVVGRNPAAHVPLRERADRLHLFYAALTVDWADREALSAEVERRGPYALAVTWTHGDPRAVARIVQRNMLPGAPHFLVRSSAAGTPDGGLLGPPYREIVLGWVRAHGTSRWLTHDEIAEGIWNSTQSDAEHAMVGCINPWEERP